MSLAACATAPEPSELPPPLPAGEEGAVVDSVPESSGSSVLLNETALRQRWREPFAVESWGTVPPRTPREAVVVIDLAPAAPSPAGTPEGELAATSAANTARDADTLAGAAPASDPSGFLGEEVWAHRVAPGETFFGIARRYDVTYSELLTANPNFDPQQIRAGQTLRIPRVGSGSSARARPGGGVHRVVFGDTLLGLARRYGVTLAALKAANDLSDDTIRVGQTLVIP